MAQSQPIWEVYVPIYGTYIEVMRQVLNTTNKQ
jgi:hypothetical protein